MLVYDRIMSLNTAKWRAHNSSGGYIGPEEGPQIWTELVCASKEWRVITWKTVFQENQLSYFL